MKLLKHLIWIVGILFVISCNNDPVVPIDQEPEEDTTQTISGYQQYGTPFINLAETGDLVMYEVNLRAFSSSGTLQGVEARLDELEQLGINIIWLMPIYPIGEINSVNSPYCVKDYKAVSSEYGTLADLRSFTDAAHQRNMAVVLDWVANHTSWDNEWINHKDWYTQDGSGNIVQPPGTNWADVADLNFNNMQMQDSMIDAMKYWVLEANVDGYRCDYADGVPYTFWKRALDSLSAIPNRSLVFLAEGSRTDHYSAGFDLTYAWDYYGKLKSVFGGQSATGIYDTHMAEYANIPAGKHKLRFTTNHDESAWDKTPMVLFNGELGALAASAITIFMEGVPMIYTGQEVGQESTVSFFNKNPIDWSQHPEMLQEYKNLLQYYTASETARKGELVDYSTQAVVCFQKIYNSDTLTCIVNTTNATANFSVPGVLVEKTKVNAFTQEEITFSESYPIDGYQYLILE